MSQCKIGLEGIIIKGTKQMSINGIDDNRQITATLTVAATEDILQVIYSGKALVSLPNSTFSTI